MSPQEAEQFFSMFFGGSDPFGGRRSTSNSSFGGGPGVSMMFGDSMMGGIPGGGSTFHMSGGMPSGQSRFGQQAESKRYDTIPKGTLVTLKGLINASQLNGDRGTIQKYIRASGRYVVQLEDSEETLSVKASNLLQHVHVRVNGIGSRPELNGKTGTVIALNPTSERYNIYVMSVEQTMSLKPGNIVFDKGTVGQITGLESKPELNGKWGTIIDWIRDTNKYDLQLSTSKIIRIKVENLRV